MNFSGSGRAFRFWGRLKGFCDSADLFSSTWIAGFGEGFRVIAGVLCACSKVSIFKDYSWILSRSYWAGWECFNAAIFIDYS